MKKLALVTTALLFVCFLQGQQLQNGNLIGVHALKMTLNPGVTMDQFIQFYTEKFIPAYESAYPGWHLRLARSLRGNVPKDNLGLIFIIDSEQTRDKYYNPDGTENELSTAANEKLKSVNDELMKYGSGNSIYTDWVLTAGNTPLPVHELTKGNMFCTHCVKVNLQQGKTMDDYIKAVNEIESPSWGKAMPNWHMYTLKRVRGEAPEGSLGMIYIADSENDRDKYFDGEKTNAEFAKINEKMKDINEEMAKVGNNETIMYTDWIIL